MAARVPPTEFTTNGGTPGASQIVALTVKNGLQNTISLPQSAAEVPGQTLVYAKSDRQIGNMGTLSSPTRRFAALVTRQPMHNLSIHYKSMIEGPPRLGSKARRKVNIARRADTPRNHSIIRLLHRALKKMPDELARQKRGPTKPERLRLDFNHPRTLSAGESERIGPVATIQGASTLAEIRRLEASGRAAGKDLTDSI